MNEEMEEYLVVDEVTGGFSRKWLPKKLKEQTEDLPVPDYDEIQEMLDGWIGWIGVVLVILGWNATGVRSRKRHAQRQHELCSEFAHRHRVVFVVFALYQAAHFAHWPKWFHEKADPLHILAERLSM